MNAWSRHDALLQRVIDTETQIAFWQAQQQHALAALEADPLPSRGTDPTCAESADERRWIAHEVAAALHLAVTTAADRIAIACTLVRQLPATVKHLESGELSFRHARAVVEATAGLEPAQMATVEQTVLPDSADASLATFTRRLDKAVHEIVPRLCQDRHASEVTERGVWIRSTRYGTLTLNARGLDPVDGSALMHHLNTRAEAMALQDKTHTDAPDRTADQRRADALLSLAYPGGDLTARPPVAINVSVALSTLIGLDQQPAELDVPAASPAAPITATQARLLAMDPSSTWRRLITDPLGRLIDYGRSTYRPPTALAEFIRARDRTCTFPGCNRQANTCDLDHHTDWAADGHTNADNLGTLCRRDHRAKHATGWTITHQPDGATTWQSPTGRTYQRPAATYPIDHTTTRAETDPDSDPDPPP